MTIFYFAYGSNMLSSRIISRIASAQYREKAILHGWRVIFNKKSKDGSCKANLVYSPDIMTWGCLYQINNNDLHILDKFEDGYTRTTVQVQTDDAEIVEATTYISDLTSDNPVAYDSYKQMVILGAKEHNLPSEYIDYLESLPSRPNQATNTI